ncbi:CbbBc protein, partial [Cupriavidus sp. SIMBA_020]
MTKLRDVPGVHPYTGPAGGWGALKATAQAIHDQMESIEAPITLMRTNQPDGFDCPGCAWGESPENGMVKFCENGAKAVNWEATGRLVNPAFFN